MGIRQRLRTIRYWLSPTMRNAEDATASTQLDTVSSLTSSSRSIRTLMQGEPSDDLTQFGPLRECLCGSELFIALVQFDEDGAIGSYFTDGRCAMCHSDVTLATEVDYGVR